MLVFPTHVGVFPTRVAGAERRGGLPHARGGVSQVIYADQLKAWSSPRTWGCFCRRSPTQSFVWVFPTHVGVFPGRSHSVTRGTRLPHARGGVSVEYQRGDLMRQSSPRTWGCFYGLNDFKAGVIVFPTHVGVFLKSASSCRSAAGLPHARGGVSRSTWTASRPWASSPRTWGCFCRHIVLYPLVSVFPTHVGVFLVREETPQGSPRLPHARGGVSNSPPGGGSLCRSSPRTWGCFPWRR
ncbi:Domain of uncharacterised function (DUF2825) [Klebsiella pneumoniae]|nr:Domain of uncharacterised function (DUF2825) [Klebsiella pneumoniae]SVV51945.1 Domain of uncharacterised function (DUF2825) [Klebsiella pneumoniae]SVY13689.1 Domain of uncharacterised function (DUF2825) [Klebsiella pneumoniae]SWG72070.1 Domain of uncharacterised function (DUF2825) [Klebsiella pneumoniae]VGH60246.1 Domain of uncharacterised function (DUF2825) [Klebsiella pneumoniae]